MSDRLQRQYLSQAILLLLLLKASQDVRNYACVKGLTHYDVWQVAEAKRIAEESDAKCEEIVRKLVSFEFYYRVSF